MSKCLKSGAIIAFMIAAAAVSAQGQEQETPAPLDYFSEYPGVYSGSYICASGENGMTISFDTIEDIHAANMPPSAGVEARLWFYDLASNPGHPSGAFTLSGIYRYDRLEAEPTGWLQEPETSWGSAGIEGEFKRDRTGRMTFSGRPTGRGTSACETFTLYRLEGL
ncbi:hypothetical protein [Ponticaulis koreensis]|uniref:hypothetical protein n=1 Tax=Ponticaulis koreensis TaxID=1123045 RepID=UPI0004264501|nr:hypothetical protein [Ponticaulis koreensis]